MKANATYTIDIDGRTRLTLTNEQAEELYKLLAELLHKTTMTWYYPTVSPYLPGTSELKVTSSLNGTSVTGSSSYTAEG